MVGVCCDADLKWSYKSQKGGIDKLKAYDKKVKCNEISQFNFHVKTESNIEV